ncbi:MAG TPA: hypothetical protein VI874_05035, partial [Candidatus Norongarragalinales archaeon]|nr:hypothetical protein [Candidatus Norongarragalinales archaeon]
MKTRVSGSSGKPAPLSNDVLLNEVKWKNMRFWILFLFGLVFLQMVEATLPLQPLNGQILQNGPGLGQLKTSEGTVDAVWARRDGRAGIVIRVAHDGPPTPTPAPDDRPRIHILMFLYQSDASKPLNVPDPAVVPTDDPKEPLREFGRAGSRVFVAQAHVGPDDPAFFEAQKEPSIKVYIIRLQKEDREWIDT